MIDQLLSNAAIYFIYTNVVMADLKLEFVLLKLYLFLWVVEHEFIFRGLEMLFSIGGMQHESSQTKLLMPIMCKHFMFTVSSKSSEPMHCFLSNLFVCVFFSTLLFHGGLRRDSKT